MSNSALPLLAFQHHVGQLYIDPSEIEFVCSLGNGELALVEKGRWHTQSGVLPVVVKGYKPFVVGSPEDFRELLLEASKLHKLRHPNITRFLGIGCFSHGTLAEVRESMYMVEEYVGTRSLRKVIGEQMRCRLKNLYDMQTALRWAAEIAAALAALHEQQPAYIHGDVKADNAFLTDVDDLAYAVAKLGDLKPHRHVYDREPCTLSQHQQHVVAAQHKRQSSLELFTLERSSLGSSTSWTSTPVNSSRSQGNGNDVGPVVWISKQQQQQQQQQAAGCVAEQEQDLSVQLQHGNSGNASVATKPEPSCDGRVARTHSMPVPIAATASGLAAAVAAGTAGSCPGPWDSRVLEAAVGGDACCFSSAGRSSSLPEQLGSADAGRMCRSMPITSCLSASEMTDVAASPAAAAAAVDVKHRTAVTAAEGQQQVDGDVDPAAAVDGSGNTWRRSRMTLSDSASSTTSNSGNSGAGRGAVGLVSLADADLEEDTLDLVDQRLLQQVAAADQYDLSCKRATTTLGSAVATLDLNNSLQEDWDCSAHAGHRQRSRSDLSRHLQEPGGSRLQRQELPLATSKSAPASVYRGALQDEKVHCGSLMESGLLLAESATGSCGSLPAKSPKQQQTATASPAPKQKPAAGALQPARKLEHSLSTGSATDPCLKKQQRQWQRSQGAAMQGWELSPSGAASPCGAVHSVMLDLFADYADDVEVPISRRPRDQYTLAPGSFVQQRITTSPAAATAVVQKSSASWDPAYNSSSISSSFAAVQQQAQQQGFERPSISKAGAPSAIESKQHGGNSAFAALTAIDCITEETSSIATDSVMGSCPPSRESTAHGGGHYFKDIPESAGFCRDQDGSASSHKSLAKAARSLGLSALLPSLSLGSSGGAGLLSSSGSGEGLYAGGSPSAAGVITASGGSDASPKQKQVLHYGSPGTWTAEGEPAAPVCRSGSPNKVSDAAEIAAAAPAKSVRFNLERPAGSTPSRDYGLLYTAPELLNGQRPTEKVDVFAFGVLLYELLSRSLLVSHCAAAVGQNRSRKGSSRHNGSPRNKDRTTHHSPISDRSTSGGPDSLPEQQLLLAYAQLVAAGYRPPFPGHFPEPVQRLISSCWAAEPHERPRMAEVLAQLEDLAVDRQAVTMLNSYLAGLADLGYAGPTGPECGCKCVIC